MIHLFKKNDKYFKRSFAPQCETSFLKNALCQGVKGHEGNCWRYDSKGWLQEFENGYRKCSPPTHENYVSPIENQNKYYLNFYTEEEITDPEIIDQIKKYKFITTEPVFYLF